MIHKPRGTLDILFLVNNPVSRGLTDAPLFMRPRLKAVSIDLGIPGTVDHLSLRLGVAEFYL